MLIRQTLLSFFQDMHIRVSNSVSKDVFLSDWQTPNKVCIILCFVLQVSIFLKDKVQNSNGRFVLPTSGPVPYGFELPGVIRYALSI